MGVPLFDPQREFGAHGAEYRAAAERVLASGRYILGPEVEAFEQEAAAYLGARHAVGCASGTDALWLGLRAAGVGPGDGVITSTFTFFATASAILTVGAVPVLCDIDPATYNIDPEAVRTVLEKRSAVHERAGVDVGRIRAIVPVHLYGLPADMTPLLDIARTHHVRVIEDAAQAFGGEYGNRKVGAIGDIGCYSFFPTKNLGAFGDGGLVVTDDDELNERLRMLRNHGGRSKYENEIVGTNSRLDALQAAMLRVRLEHIHEALAARQRIAALYEELMGDGEIGIPTGAGGCVHAWNYYTVRVPERDRVQRALGEKGVRTAVYYEGPVHLQPAVGLNHRRGDFPEAERACAEVLSLPIFPRLRTDEVEEVAKELQAALNSA